MPHITCINCNDQYYCLPSRLSVSKYCSRKCQREYNGWNSLPNASCAVCGKDMHLKPSKLKSLKHQPTCSRACVGKLRSSVYAGNKNPNYRGKGINHDGYRVTPPYGNGMREFTDEKLMHKAVASKCLGVRKIKGFHVHHRDCDVLNNTPSNLAVLSASDHKWIHKQFGNATLWAFMKGKVDLIDLISWSDDKDRAERLLTCCVTNQAVSSIGCVIDGVLCPAIR